MNETNKIGILVCKIIYKIVKTQCFLIISTIFHFLFINFIETSGSIQVLHVMYDKSF